MSLAEWEAQTVMHTLQRTWLGSQTKMC